MKTVKFFFFFFGALQQFRVLVVVGVGLFSDSASILSVVTVEPLSPLSLQETPIKSLFLFSSRNFSKIMNQVGVELEGSEKGKPFFSYLSQYHSKKQHFQTVLLRFEFSDKS